MSLTALEQDLLSDLTSRAASNRTAPSNDVIAYVLGTHSVSTSQKVMNSLVAKGFIAVEIYSNRRVVEIVATGARTAPPKRMKLADTGRSSVVSGRETRGRSHKKTATAPVFPREKDLSWRELMKYSNPIAPSRTCQYIYTDPLVVVIMCGEKTKPGSSYCLEHHKICYYKMEKADGRKTKGQKQQSTAA